jgi:virulence-associated protein VagC
MPIATKTFLNGRSTAVRIPAEFGIKPGEELVVSQEADGTVRLARAKPFAGFFAAIERMRAEGNDPARDPPLELPRMGPPRRVDLGERPGPGYRAPKKRRAPR